MAQDSQHCALDVDLCRLELQEHVEGPDREHALAIGFGQVEASQGAHREKGRAVNLAAHGPGKVNGEQSVDRSAGS